MAEDSYELFQSLSIQMKFYIVLGLEFSFAPGSQNALRETVCLHVHKMYNKRRNVLNVNQM